MGRTWLFPQVRWNSRSAQRLRRGDAIEVTGVAFFDFLHQQRGAAANGLSCIRCCASRRSRLWPVWSLQVRASVDPMKRTIYNVVDTTSVAEVLHCFETRDVDAW